MMTLRSASTVLALPVLLALAASPAVHAQQNPSSPEPTAQGNKAAKPPVDAAASQSGVATRKPAKPGVQSGPTTPEAEAAKGNKAGTPAADDDTARADVATKKPAKPGAQSGPASSPHP